MTATTGVWQPGVFLAGPANVNFVSLLGAELFVAQAALVEGSAPMAPFGVFGGSYLADLQACQRYFEKSYSLDTAPGTGSQQPGYRCGFQRNDGTNYDGAGFHTVKRAAATVRLIDYGSGGTHGGLNVDGAGETGFGISGNGVTSYCFHFTAEAEL
jgi:hypothetical protein